MVEFCPITDDFHLDLRWCPLGCITLIVLSFVFSKYDIILIKSFRICSGIMYTVFVRVQDLVWEGSIVLSYSILSRGIYAYLKIIL
jgi:hypothetical protein